MDFKELKKGDRLKYVEFSFNLYDAIVIENFVDKEILYVKIKVGFLSYFKAYNTYNSVRFLLAKKKQ